MNTKKYFLFFFSLLFTYPIFSQTDSLRVARIFSDNMVLQQHISASVWGWDKPGETIYLSLAEDEYKTSADSTGKWQIRLNPLNAGGPYDMVIENSSRQTKKICNILVGEVWLASGQSNMNFSVAGVVSAEKEIEAADYPYIREFRTPNEVSRLPQKDMIGGEWVVCSPENVRGFSAVAYYFAKSLYLDKKVPVGIIHTSWSGSICEAWISSEALCSLPEYKKQVVNEIYNSDSNWGEYHRSDIEKDVQREKIFLEGEDAIKKGIANSDFDDSSWEAAEYPIYAVSIGSDGYKIVWLRKTIDLPAASTGKNLKIHLGKIMTGDITYFNGEEVGRERWDGARNYDIPARLVKKGKNTIAIKLLSEWDSGCIGDEVKDSYVYSQDNKIHISLKGSWKYNGRIEPELPVGNSNYNRISALFNTKINPLIPYGIRGFLWYQGEGNSGDPQLYKKLQSTMLSDWRIRFQQGYLPFIYVQLPNITGRLWQYFREAQEDLLKYPNTAMVVSIDAGDPYNIHPADKKPIGERMFLAAKKLVYNDTVVASGPKFESFNIKGDSIVLSFSDVGTGLVSKDNLALRCFEISPDGNYFVPAQAMIKNNQVIVYNTSIKNPVSVRYAWSSNPDVNLFNKEGLPAQPFRTFIESSNQ